jgi:hypothetical protein
MKLLNVIKIRQNLERSAKRLATKNYFKGSTCCAKCIITASFDCSYNVPPKSILFWIWLGFISVDISTCKLTHTLKYKKTVMHGEMQGGL